jgi:hypothetical protein
MAYLGPYFFTKKHTIIIVIHRQGGLVKKKRHYCLFKEHVKAESYTVKMVSDFPISLTKLSLARNN